MKDPPGEFLYAEFLGGDLFPEEWDEDDEDWKEEEGGEEEEGGGAAGAGGSLAVSQAEVRKLMEDAALPLGGGGKKDEDEDALLWMDFLCGNPFPEDDDEGDQDYVEAQNEDCDLEADEDSEASFCMGNRMSSGSFAASSSRHWDNFIPAIEVKKLMEDARQPLQDMSRALAPARDREMPAALRDGVAAQMKIFFQLAVQAFTQALYSSDCDRLKRVEAAKKLIVELCKHRQASRLEWARHALYPGGRDDMRLNGRRITRGVVNKVTSEMNFDRPGGFYEIKGLCEADELEKKIKVALYKAVDTCGSEPIAQHIVANSAAQVALVSLGADISENLFKSAPSIKPSTVLPAEENLMVHGLLAFKSENWESIRDAYFPHREVETLKVHYTNRTQRKEPENPLRRFRRARSKLRRFTSHEDNLLRRGIETFETLGTEKLYVGIQRRFLPHRSVEEITRRCRILRNRANLENDVAGTMVNLSSTKLGAKGGPKLQGKESQSDVETDEMPSDGEKTDKEPAIVAPLDDFRSEQSIQRRRRRCERDNLRPADDASSLRPSPPKRCKEYDSDIEHDDMDEEENHSLRADTDIECDEMPDSYDNVEGVPGVGETSSCRGEKAGGDAAEASQGLEVVSSLAIGGSLMGGVGNSLLSLPSVNDLSRLSSAGPASWDTNMDALDGLSWNSLGEVSSSSKQAGGTDSRAAVPLKGRIFEAVEQVMESGKKEKGGIKAR